MKPHLLFFVPRPNHLGGDGVIVSTTLLNANESLPQPHAPLLGNLVDERAAITGNTVVGLAEIEPEVESLGLDWFAVIIKIDQLARAGVVDSMRIPNVPQDILLQFGAPPAMASYESREANRVMIENRLAKSTNGNGLGEEGPRNLSMHNNVDIRQKNRSIARAEVDVIYDEAGDGLGTFRLRTIDGETLIDEFDIPLVPFDEIEIGLQDIGYAFLKTKLELVLADTDASDWVKTHQAEIVETLIGISIEATSANLEL